MNVSPEVRINAILAGRIAREILYCNPAILEIFPKLKKESGAMTVLEVVNEFLAEFDSVKVQSKVNGKRLYLPLSQVQDQRKVLQVLMDRLKAEFPPIPKKKKGEEEEAAE